MRALSRLAPVAAIAAALTVLPAAPAHATVHEIVAQWCAGHDPLEPPGVSGGSKADNVAKPLMATGFITGIEPFQDGFRIGFNYDLRAAKTIGTGVFVVIGEIEGAPLYLELIQPDPNFPAFQRCPRLAG